VQVIVETVGSIGRGDKHNVGVTCAELARHRLLALLHGLEGLDAPHLDAGLLGRVRESLLGGSDVARLAAGAREELIA